MVEPINHNFTEAIVQEISRESGYFASIESNGKDDVNGIAKEEKADRPNHGNIPDLRARNELLFRTRDCP